MDIIMVMSLSLEGVLQEKAHEAELKKNESEKRATMAESMLQAFMAAAPAEGTYHTFGARGGGCPALPQQPHA